MIRTTFSVDGSEEDAIAWNGPARAGNSPGRIHQSTPCRPPIRVYRVASPTTIIEVQENAEGFLDQQHLEAIVGRLEEMVADATYGDVVIDLCHVTSVGAQFLNVVDSFRWRLKTVGRRLNLCGVHPQCADLLCFVGLDELIHCRAGAHC